MHRLTMNLMAGGVLLMMLSACANARVQDEFYGFSRAELDQMLAPVALYPDTVLSHLLIAATYPLEVVQAARWSRQNSGFRGEVAVEAVVDYPWDPSVMALVAFPELLDRMDNDLDWTQRLGDAFLYQEEEVLDSIQHLRTQAHHAGHLSSNDHVRVVRERKVIYIEPARREVIYLPYYQPRVVYGRWHWSDYPPVAWYHPRRYRASLVLNWSVGYRVAPTFFFSSFHWPRRQVVVVHHHHHHYRPSHYPRPRHIVDRHFHSGREIAHYEGAQRWRHQREHRRGVAYRSTLPQRHRQRAAALRAQGGYRDVQSHAHSVKPKETRSQQRQWAAARRSELNQTSSLASSQSRQSRVRGTTRSARSESATARTSSVTRTQRSRNAQALTDRSASSRSAPARSAPARSASTRSASTRSVQSRSVPEVSRSRTTRSPSATVSRPSSRSAAVTRPTQDLRSSRSLSTQRPQRSRVESTPRQTLRTREASRPATTQRSAPNRSAMPTQRAKPGRTRSADVVRSSAPRASDSRASSRSSERTRVQSRPSAPSRANAPRARSEQRTAGRAAARRRD